MTRRAFLAFAAVIGASAGALIIDRGPALRLRKAARRLEGFGRSPADRLRTRYAWLPAEPSAFDRYVTDYERHFGRLARGRFSIPRSDFFTRFLLCTNFFTGDDGQARDGVTIQYTGFYEPATSPCHNPLARRPPSDAELADLASRRAS